MADCAFKLPSVADHVLLRFTSPVSALTKLDFYVHKLKVSVLKLTISNISSFSAEAAERVAKCPQLQGLTCEGNVELTDAAVEHLATCPQLQCVDVAALRTEGVGGMVRS